MTDTLPRAIVADHIRSRWKPFILAHNYRAAEWLAHDLCMTPHEWRFLNRGDDLRARREATVLVLEDWRYKRSMSNWLEIEDMLKAMDACLVLIPSKHEMPVQEWFEAVIRAFDAVRVRPRTVSA